MSSVTGWRSEQSTSGVTQEEHRGEYGFDGAAPRSVLLVIFAAAPTAVRGEEGSRLHAHLEHHGVTHVRRVATGPISMAAAWGAVDVEVTVVQQICPDLKFQFAQG